MSCSFDIGFLVVPGKPLALLCEKDDVPLAFCHTHPLIAPFRLVGILGRVRRHHPTQNQFTTKMSSTLPHQSRLNHESYVRQYSKQDGDGGVGRWCCCE